MSDDSRCPYAAETSSAVDGSRIHRRRSRPPEKVPTYDHDLYTPTAIQDPYPHYRALRELGPVVWLSKHKMFAITQHAEVRAVLADDTTFRSRDAVALTRFAQFFGRQTTILSDDGTHVARRKAVTNRLTPRAVRSMKPAVYALADRVVRDAVARGDVEGVADIALAMPLTVVPDLMGWPDRGRDRLLAWGVAAFDFAGPANRLFWKSLPGTIAMRVFVDGVIRRGDAMPDSVAAELIASVKNGSISRNQCALMLIDILAPSIDTTASIIAAALDLFAENPVQWAALKRDRSLVPAAVHEIVRHSSPLRAFTRRVAHDTIVAGTAVDAGEQVLVLFASANRDELTWDDPDAFDITRDAAGHMGFGYGAHTCGGQGLARMETAAILEALLDHVDTIERRGPGKRAINNVIFRWEELPIRLTRLHDSDPA